jgi:predicted nuclease of restriction endonuclease-like (RecB) superfamily
MEEKNIVTTKDTKLAGLADNIAHLVTSARVRVAQSINTTLVETYWQVGRYIVEFEQQGNVKAKYGDKLLTSLAKLLSDRLGRGFSRPNLNNMRKFYLYYPICQTVSDNLSWSHICELITIDDALERSFYEKECIAGHWNVRSLRRQMDSALYLRLAASKDKAGILRLAENGMNMQRPEDVVKDTYTLEFLGLPEQTRYSESDLEQRLIDNLQTFLLELGKGFTYVGRQYPLTIGNRHYRIDLVFYHRIMKCFVLIDLKKNAVKHHDIGQMNMYMGYFAKEENAPDDNPPVGIVLAHNKDELMVEYATYGMDTNLFVSKYELYLPNKEELRRLIDGVLNQDLNSANR